MARKKLKMEEYDFINKKLKLIKIILIGLIIMYICLVYFILNNLVFKN